MDSSAQILKTRPSKAKVLCRARNYRFAPKSICKANLAAVTTDLDLDLAFAMHGITFPVYLGSDSEPINRMVSKEEGERREEKGERSLQWLDYNG